MGSKVVKKGLFLNFLKRLSLDFAKFQPEWGSYSPSNVCKVWSRGKSGSLDMGSFVTPKRPPKGSFDCFSKTVHLILLIFCQNGALIVLQVCAKFGVQEKSGFPEIWENGPKSAQNRTFSDFSQNPVIGSF